MTYPPQGPQGPYGQQPDPYGQQPQQPQYGGGYQQQPTGQYGGYDPNAQQQPYGAYDPNAQYGGGYQQYPGGPQPPKKNKGPVIAIVAILVLVVAGLGITGFVAPGFFLSDDKKDSADDNGGGGGGGDDDKGSGADAFIEKLVAAADGKNKSELRSAACKNASENVDGAINNIDEISSAKLKDTREESKSEVVAVLTIKVDGDTDDYAATVTKDGADWCWQDFAPGDGTGGGGTDAPSSPDEDTSTSEEPSTGGGGGGGGGSGEPDPADGEATIDDFLDKMNAGDGTGASAMICSDSTYGPAIEETAKQNPALEKKPGTLDADTISVSTDLQGTLNGQDAIGTMSAFTEDDGTWCIYTFFAG